MTELVRYESAHGVATLTLDSPHNRNALSRALMAELLAGLRRAQSDDTIRVIVLGHEGRVFCSGADLKETGAASDTGSLPVSSLPEILQTIWESAKPVVARVAGPARAGGVGLVAACDIAVVSETATFAFTEVRLGVIPAVISAVVLPRLLPRAAHELFLTGEVFDGRRAAAIGLATSAVTDEALEEEVRRYAGMIVRGAPGALAATKALLRRTPVSALAGDFAELSALSARHFTGEEGREGIRAFAEKRDPSWVPREQG